MRGSWWSHPLARLIFAVNEQLEDHADVLVTKLLSGKVTFVHRRLWSALFAIGSSRADWQTQGLSNEAEELLKLIERENQLRTDKLNWPKDHKTKIGDAARQLEQRLLVVSHQVHTEKGAHAKLMQTWEAWSKDVRFKPRRTSVREAMGLISPTVKNLNEQFGGNATLPWDKR